MTKNEENGPIHLQNAHTKGSQRRAFGHWGPLWARISGNEPAHGLDWANWFDFVEYSGLGCEFDWLRRGLGEILGERDGKKTEVSEEFWHLLISITRFPSENGKITTWSLKFVWQNIYNTTALYKSETLKSLNDNEEVITAWSLQSDRLTQCGQRSHLLIKDHSIAFQKRFHWIWKLKGDSIGF